MAEFYKKENQTQADYTGYSKGFKSSNAVGEVFEGLGDAVKMGVTAADEYFKGTIKEEVRGASEELYTDYGVDAAVDAQTTGDATPKEIQQGFNRLKLLKQAQANGTLKESSFWAQAELTSRQLKMRYPGHWEDVDNSMSQIMGRKPAQAVRQALQAEREAAASKSDVEARQAYSAARSAGLIEPFVRKEQGKPMTTNEINTLVANRNAVKWDQEAAAREYTLKKNRNELREQDVLTAQRTEAQTEIMTMLKDTSSPLFSDRKEYETFIREANRQRESGGTVNPQLQSQIAVAAQRVRQTVNDIKNKYTLKYASDADSGKLKDNIDFLSEWTDNFITSVEKGDLDVGGVNVAYLKSFQDYGTAKLLQKSDALRKHNAVRSALGEQPYSLWYNNNVSKKVVLERDIAIEDFMTNGTLLDATPITENITQMVNEKISNPATFNQHVNRVTDAVTTDKMPDNLRSNAIEALFGEKNLNFLQNNVSSDERLPMFLKLTSPKMIRSMKQYTDEGRITSNDFEKFSTWMSTNALQLMQDNTAELNSINTSRKSIKVFYDPESHLIKSDDISYEGIASTSLGRAIERDAESTRKRSARSAILNVDGVIRNMKVLMEQTGDDPSQVIPLMLEKAGIDLTVVEDKGKTGAEPAVQAVEQGSAYIYEGFDKMGRNAANEDEIAEGYRRLSKSLGFE